MAATNVEDKAIALENFRENSSNLSLCTCRICQTVKSREELISPCNCKGTLGKVHLSCLEKWLNMCGRQHCEICKYQFLAKKTRRYSCLQSIRIWFRHPRHQVLFRSDIIIATILTSVTIALCCICSFGMRFFVIECLKLGVPPVYTEGMVLLFLTFIILGYMITIYLIARDHIVPWYRWWTRCMVIKIVVAPPGTDKLVEPTPTSTSTKCSTEVESENLCSIHIPELVPTHS